MKTSTRSAWAPCHVVLLALVFALLPVTGARAQARTITVSAAASLTDAFRELGAAFEASHPGVAVRFNFAASGVLVQQIVQGAPVDVFASADEATVDRGVREQVLDAATRRDFASNTLVLVVPGVGGVPVAKLADLAGPAVRRIAVGKAATMPVGRYTRQALEAAGLWAGLEPKLVYADTVRQVLDYVVRGEADAAFVYATDAVVVKPGSVRVVAEVGGHAPVRYPVAVVADSRQPALAREFAAALLAPPAQAVLARHGFGRP